MLLGDLKKFIRGYPASCTMKFTKHSISMYGPDGRKLKQVWDRPANGIYEDDDDTDEDNQD